MSLKYPAAVLWDMDGTLIDSEHYWMQAEQELASGYPGEWLPEHGLNLIGLSLYESTQIMKKQMQIHDLEPEQIIDFLTNSVLSQLMKEIHWRPGARELLLELREQKIPTALVTMSMNRMANAVASNLGFKVFDLVLGGDDVQFGKPHPEPYLKAAELLGVNANECVAFEDSLNGIASAEAAGTVAIGVPNLIEIPDAPTRTVWSGLAGKSLTDIAMVYTQRTQQS